MFTGDLKLLVTWNCAIWIRQNNFAREVMCELLGHQIKGFYSTNGQWVNPKKQTTSDWIPGSWATATKIAADKHIKSLGETATVHGKDILARGGSRY